METQKGEQEKQKERKGESKNYIWKHKGEIGITNGNAEGEQEKQKERKGENRNYKWNHKGETGITN